MRMPIPFAGEHGIARSGHQSYQKLQNLYTETNKAGKYPIVHYRIPGIKTSIADLGSSPLRSNGALFDGKIYFVAGNALYSIDQSQVVTSIGTIATSSGRVSIIEGQTFIMLVDGDDGYTYDGTTFGAIADADFPANQTPKLLPKHVTYKDGFFIVVCSNDANYYVSDLEDPTSWDGLRFANAEARPDLLKTLHSADDFLYLFGEYSTEAWYNAGVQNNPFVKAEGGVSTWGVDAEWSVAEAGDTIFFLGRKRDGGKEVCRTKGASVAVISTSEISDEINNLSQTSDAFGFGYTQRGHEFYVITFPVGQKTFVYDIKEGLWHTRHSKDIGRWRPNGHGYYKGIHYVGNPTDGQMYELDFDTYTDAGDYISCVRTTPPIHKDMRELIFHELVLDLEGGVGDSITDPTIMMRYSDDGGKTWSDEVWAQIGKVGNYSYKAYWHQLGASHERIFEFKTTDSFFTAWLGAYADVTLSNH